VDTGYFIDQHVEVEARYDQLNQNADSIGLNRSYHTLTLGLQYHFTPSVRAVLNYEIRDYQMDGVGYRSPDSQSNASRVDSAGGNRLAFQLSLGF
jgi:phosphate-selective porin